VDFHRIGQKRKPPVGAYEITVIPNDGPVDHSVDRARVDLCGFCRAMTKFAQVLLENVTRILDVVEI
jgi:hypothetical protein